MKRLAIGAALVASAVLAPATVAAGDNAKAKPAETKVQMGLSYFPESMTRQYSAVLKTSDKCLGDRRVTFFQVVPGKDEKIDSAKTSGDGFAFVSSSPAPSFENGDKFKAKVKKTSKCEAGKDTVEVRPAPRAGGKEETRLVFLDIVPVDTDYWYEGTIDSNHKKCTDKRRVTVYRVKSGKDEKVGSTESNGSTGSWTVMDSETADGKYYARTPATDDCHGDKSDKLTIHQI